MIEALLAPLGYEFFLRALAAAALVGLVCAVVGSYMILRGLSYMGDAISHAAFPGVVAAYLVSGPFYLGAAIAAVSRPSRSGGSDDGRACAPTPSSGSSSRGCSA